MHQVLIAYSTSEGHTLKVAQFIAEVIRERGHLVDIADVSMLRDSHFCDGYDGVILGASIHAGKHQKSMVRFAQKHASTLKELSTAFFSVSLTSVTKDRGHRAQADQYVNEFFAEVGWIPDRVWFVAGAVAYLKYSVLKRLLIKQIVKREGGDTDTSRNYEYTDWNELRESVHEFLNDILEPHFAGTGTF